MVWAGNKQVVPGSSVQFFFFIQPSSKPSLTISFLCLKLLENMLTFTVPSVSIDINDEKCILADFLSKVPVVQRQA